MNNEILDTEELSAIVVDVAFHLHKNESTISSQSKLTLCKNLRVFAPSREIKHPLLKILIYAILKVLLWNKRLLQTN